MAKIKDWKKGTFRIKMEMITPEGNKMEFYIPWVPQKIGEVFIAVATVASRDLDPKGHAKVLSEVRAWLKELREVQK